MLNRFRDNFVKKKNVFFKDDPDLKSKKKRSVCHFKLISLPFVDQW